MTMNGKEFPNNWQDIADTDSEHFASCDYDEFMVAAALWTINNAILFKNLL